MARAEGRQPEPGPGQAAVLGNDVGERWIQMDGGYAERRGLRDCVWARSKRNEMVVNGGGAM